MLKKEWFCHEIEREVTRAPRLQGFTFPPTHTPDRHRGQFRVSLLLTSPIGQRVIKCIWLTSKIKNIEPSHPWVFNCLIVVCLINGR